MAENDKEDWDKTLEAGKKIQLEFIEVKKKYDKWCIDTFGVKDGDPLNLIQLANMVRQIK